MNKNRGSKFYQGVMNQEAEKRKKGLEILAFLILVVLGIVLLLFMLLSFPDLVADFVELIKKMLNVA